MQSKIKGFMIFLFLILLFSPIYSFELPSDLVEINHVRELFNHYISKQKGPISDNILSYIISNKNNEIEKKEIVYKNIFIPNPGQVPYVINSKAKYIDVFAGFENVYFNSYNTKYGVDSSCSNAIRSYYSKKNEDLIAVNYINLDNVNYVIEKIIAPRTKSSLVAYLSKNNVHNPEKCIADLEDNKNLYSFPILFVLKSKLIGTKEEIGNGFNFEVKFEPEFLSPIETQKFMILFRKDPIQLSSIYALPKGCENPTISGQCYITQKDIDNFNIQKIKSSESVVIDGVLNSILNNFNVVSDFQDQSFEDINTKELLVDLSLTREHFCFRKDNDEYTDTIFRVAKAYDLSLEQAFQLWSLISELSNCNNNLNPKLYSFAQIDLSGRDSGNLINIEQVTSKQTTTISNTLPLQLAEEEQFQYLALGDFKEINTHLLNNVYNGNKNKFYNLGYNGIINNDNGYFGFLINAIKNNKDDFGPTVLFTSDYIKELNYLIKNSREKSSNPFSFEDFVLENENSINSIYVLASLSNKDNAQQIYNAGKFSDLFKPTAFFVKDGANIKSTKEVRVLINYLVIKRKYFRDPQYFLKYNLSTGLSSSKLGAYEKLDHKYWDTKKNVYLKTLEDKNIKLMLKKDLGHYNYDKLLLVPAKANYPVKYVMDFGQNTYVNGFQNYLNPGAHAWAFDTKKGAIDNYNLIWEASDVCVGKSVCEENAFTGKNCCKENKEVQDGKTYYQYIDILVDGAIIGIYNPTSKYNDENREYTHLAIYIGKTITGLPLIAESTVDGQKISILTKDIRNRVKRIYVPKNTNIKNIKDVILNPDIYPKTYINLTNAQLIQLEKISQDRKSKTDYYEDPNNIGEGDIEYLEQNEFSQKIAERARHYANLGTKYIFGGRNGYKLDGGFQLKKGIDCVGLLYVVMRDLGYIDGSTSCKEIFENDCTIADFIEPVKKKDSDLRKGHILGIVGTIETRADLDKLQSGDLLFLHTKYYFGHAGIYDKKLPNGNHQYIHASGPGAPAKVTYNTLEEKLNSGALKLPFHYGRITLIDMSNVDCSSNYISYYKRKLDCCQVTDYCKFYK
jgi:hypothetical protein